MNLRKHNTVKNLLRRWQNTLSVTEMAINNLGTGFEFRLIIDKSPIPSQPFEIFVIDQAKPVDILVERS